MRKLTFGMVAAASLAVAAPIPAQATDITLGRFFGACENAGTDVAAAVGEACIIQSIINAFSAADNGVTVETLPTDWGNYYDQIKAAYAGGTAPNVHVMHKSHLAEFASLGALADITDDLAGAGIDVNDWVEKAKEGVTYDGRIYGVPMDIHANLWHVNMDILDKAGLVKDGKPVLPTNPEELLAQAKQVKEKTGKEYLAADFSQFPIGVRLVLSLMWQQGANIFDADGTATVDSPEALNAVKAITQLFDGGYANPKLNYADSEKAFLNGDAAILVNGTWVVDSYTAQANKPDVALKNYYVSDFPQIFQTEPATWADSHMWAIPANLKANDPEKYQAALQYMAFLLKHDIDWARTGHLAVLQSVLGSDAYKSLPHRAEYSGTAKLAHDVPQTKNYGAIQDVLNRQFQSIWLTGADPDSALKTANEEVQDQLDK
jgi:multiple sugar transport system substrate-binding protein